MWPPAAKENTHQYRQFQSMLLQNPGEDRVHGCHGCHMFAGFRCGFITGIDAQYAHNLARIITVSFATIINHLSN
jgi:hypothetical protein